MKLAVLRVGPVDVSGVQTMQNGLDTIFSEATCTLLKHVMPIPQEAYSLRRRQYNSTKILMRIRDYAVGLDVDRVLGVVDVDLYVSGLNFVFGEAEHPGKAAVISFYRLRPEFYGHPSDRKLLAERCIKEAVHEIGHTLGLSHCNDSSCVMFFSNNIQMTDTKECNFCESCARIVISVFGSTAS